MDIIKRLHLALLFVKMNIAIAQHLRLRPDECGGHAARAPYRGSGINECPLRAVLRPQNKARKIMLCRRGVAKPRGGRRRTARRSAAIARRHPIIILKLEDIKRGCRPTKRHIGALEFGSSFIKHRRQIGEK